MKRERLAAVISNGFFGAFCGGVWMLSSVAHLPLRAALSESGWAFLPAWLAFGIVRIWWEVDAERRAPTPRGETEK
jgi:hypothetical protein